MIQITTSNTLLAKYFRNTLYINQAMFINIAKCTTYNLEMHYRQVTLKTHHITIKHRKMLQSTTSNTLFANVILETYHITIEIC